MTSILDNAESAAIVNAIARLGDSLNLPVTAEGIEDSAIEERLRQLGCHKGQGWFYGRPTPIMQTRTLLAERNLLPNARIAPIAVEVEAPVVPMIDEAPCEIEPLRRSA